MAMIFEEVVFEGRAPDSNRIAAKVTERCGLPVVVEDSDAEIKGTLYDIHAHLAFACASEERIEIFSYRPGAVRAFYDEAFCDEAFCDEAFDGIELLTARFITGLNEPQGSQSVHLRGWLGLEPTLLATTILALEALGGRPRQPISDEERRAYGAPITEAQLQERRRKLYEQLRRAARYRTLMLPITMPLVLVRLLGWLVTMPWRFWKAWRLYKTWDADREKRELLRKIPEHMDHVATTPQEFPALDRQTLDNYTQALHDLGFVTLMDYSVRANVPTFSPGFARLFVHSEHRCFAEVNQVFPEASAPSAMACTLGSLLEDGWALSITDREPILFSFLTRRPRELSCRCPGKSPKDLLGAHLQRRQAMLDALRLSVAGELTPGYYFARSRQSIIERKRTLEAKSLATIRAETKDFERSPEYEWFGELLARSKEGA